MDWLRSAAASIESEMNESITGSAPSTPAAAAKGGGKEKDDAAPAKRATPSSLPASTSRGSGSKAPRRTSPTNAAPASSASSASSSRRRGDGNGNGGDDSGDSGDNGEWGDGSWEASSKSTPGKKSSSPSKSKATSGTSTPATSTAKASKETPGQEKKMKLLLLKLRKENKATKEKCAAAEQAQAQAEADASSAKAALSKAEAAAVAAAATPPRKGGVSVGGAAASETPGQEKKLKQLLLKLKKELKASKEKCTAAEATAAHATAEAERATAEAHAAAAGSSDPDGAASVALAEVGRKLKEAQARFQELEAAAEQAKAESAATIASLSANETTLSDRILKLTDQYKSARKELDAADSTASAGASANSELEKVNSTLRDELAELRAAHAEGGNQSLADELSTLKDELAAMTSDAQKYGAEKEMFQSKLKEAEAATAAAFADATSAAATAVSAAAAAGAASTAQNAGVGGTDARIAAWAANIFGEADKNRDGTLTKGEVKKYFKAHPKDKQRLLGKDFSWASFFEKMDGDGNGSFDLAEFTRSCVALCKEGGVGGSSDGAGHSDAASSAEGVSSGGASPSSDAAVVAAAAPPAADQEKWAAAVKAVEAERDAALAKLAAAAEAASEAVSAAEASSTEAATALRAADGRVAAATQAVEAAEAAKGEAEAATKKVRKELADQLAQFESFKDALSGEASENVNVLTAELAAASAARDAMLERANAADAATAEAAEAAKDTIAALTSAAEAAEAEAEEAAKGALAAAEKELAASAAELGKLQSSNKGLRDVLASERETRAAEADDSKEEVRQLQAECTTIRAKQQQLDVAKARLETQLSQEKESHAATKEALSSSTAEGSKSSMLDLELADYKRTADSLQSKVNDLAEQLEAERTRVKDAAATAKELEGQIEKHGSLKSKDEETRTKLKALLLKAKKELSDKRTTIKASKALEGKLTADKEAKTQEVEKVKLEMSDVTVALSNMETAKREADVAHEVALRTLHFDLETARRELTMVAASAKETEEEFKSYKVRAHTVLKQKEEEPKQQVAPENNPEMAGLEKKVEVLAQQVADLTADLIESGKACEEAEAENDGLRNKLEALTKEMARVSSTLKLQLSQTQEAQDLSEQEHARATRQIKMDHAMLVRSQKEEIENVTTESAKKLKLMEGELDEMRAKICEHTANGGGAGLSSSLQSRNASAASAGIPGNAAAIAAATAKLSRPPAFPATQGSGGGAPSSSSGPQVDTQQAAMVSDLGHLLSAPGGGRSSTSTRTGEGAGARVVAGAASSAELQAAKRQIGHLAELLADSEGMIDRLQEQSQVLKSEIRRQEHLVARADGANLEYLKNVVLKFITAVEEREQLIPVFGMLLHFTQEELKDATKKFKVLVAMQQQQQVQPASTGLFGAWT